MEDVQWPKVECNLKWLEQRWPHETDVPVAAETVESPPQAERPPAPVAPAPPAAKNVSEAALERCIRAMEKECAEQQRLPPTEKELHEEVEHRLETEVPRDRVRDARDRVAPNFRRPVGKPRKNAQ